ncbi:hypothetical protein RND71_008333 [Anisodus tanguticus]|uniref:Uncharacterized protein n=1 Tax=Anisodus tanguticus TaxID=243964 RepID=A0AAE1SNH3_9SOLA|nr:hypothetical protein RND71_008333 [Anisodus tanguticus]
MKMISLMKLFFYDFSIGLNIHFSSLYQLHRPADTLRNIFHYYMVLNIQNLA